MRAIYLLINYNISTSCTRWFFSASEFQSGFANESNAKRVCAFSEGKAAHGASSLFTKNQRATNELHLAAKKGCARKMLMVGTNILPSRRSQHSRRHIALSVLSSQLRLSKERFSFMFLMRKMLFHCHIGFSFAPRCRPPRPTGRKAIFQRRAPSQKYMYKLCFLRNFQRTLVRFDSSGYAIKKLTLNWLGLIKIISTAASCRCARTKSWEVEAQKSRGEETAPYYLFMDALDFRDKTFA